MSLNKRINKEEKKNGRKFHNISLKPQNNSHHLCEDKKQKFSKFKVLRLKTENKKHKIKARIPVVKNNSIVLANKRAMKRKESDIKENRVAIPE